MTTGWPPEVVTHSGIGGSRCIGVHDYDSFACNSDTKYHLMGDLADYSGASYCSWRQLAVSESMVMQYEGEEESICVCCGEPAGLHVYKTLDHNHAGYVASFCCQSHIAKYEKIVVESLKKIYQETA